MDYIEFSKLYYRGTNIPIACYEDGLPVYSAFADVLSMTPLAVYEFENSRRNPDYCTLQSFVQYGRIAIPGTSFVLVLGPAYNVPVTDTLARKFMHENALPSSYLDQVREFLLSIPVTTSYQFIHQLTFLYYCVTGTKLDLAALLFTEPEETAANLHAAHANASFEAKENMSIHNTYYYEQGLYQRIRDGRPDQLAEYMKTPKLQLQEGHVADTPLRQCKNIFIGTVTKIGMLGAIPGGLDVEQTYQLIDLYVRECEQMTSVLAVQSLHQRAALDFCTRVGQAQTPGSLSLDVHKCMTFIRSHTNENISIADVAAHIGRSPSYIVKRFQTELGFTMGAYITRCKLEEAKSLLSYSDKSLADISEYLCFSSQSYFQNVFKKKYGVTPNVYRKQHQSGKL